MKRPTFSVITANFNSGDKLAASIDSVRQQNADAEHWIVDGASTDDSLALARRLAAEDPTRIHVHSERDRGVYDAMNKGIHAANGRYLYFLGAGDTLRPGVLNAVAAHLPEHDHGFVYGDVWWDGRTYDGRFNWRKIAAKNICHQAIFYGREVFAWLGEYDLTYRIYADHEFNLRCFNDKRVRPHYMPITVADYEGGGLSVTSSDPFLKDYVRLLRRNYSTPRYAWLRLGHARKKLQRTARGLLGRS